MEKQFSPNVTQQNEFSQTPVWHNLLKVVLILVLLFIGLLIELSPKWDESLIHIPLSPGHGFTTQDTVALIPISLALILLINTVWKYRPTLKQRIATNPHNAFALALIIGLSLGLLLGIGLGMLFKIPLVIFLKEILKPIQTVFFG